MKTHDPGNNIIEINSIIFEIILGFSKGVDELAPKNPPPLVPKCLIASKAATGPAPSSWFLPSIVLIKILELKFWITPWDTNNNPTIIDAGNKNLVMIFIKSTKKFPIFSPSIPLIIATQAAYPLAAEVNIIIIITNIWEKYDKPDSPA